MFKIKKATKDDLLLVKELIQLGRQRQIASGNDNQWGADYPSDKLLNQDFEQGTIYLCEAKHQTIGTFSLFTTPDPTYKKMKSGKWLNDEPYVTIHRLATNGACPGAGQFCIRWVQERFKNIRIDTHEDNQAMRHILEKLGFIEVGLIILEDGTERLAYHYVK